MTLKSTAAEQTRARVARGAISSTLAGLAELGLGLLANAMLARSLGPNDYGRYTLAIWLTGWLVAIAFNGLGLVATSQIGLAIGRRDALAAERARAWTGRMLLAGAAVSAAALAATLSTYRFSAWPEMPAWAVLAILVAFPIKARFMLAVNIAKAQFMFGTERVANIAIGGSMCVLVGYAYWRGLPLPFYLAAFATASLLGWAIVERRIWHKRPAFDVPVKLLDARLGSSWFSLALLSLAYQVGTPAIVVFLLGARLDAREMGFYLLAQSMARLCVAAFSQGLMSVMLSAIARSEGAGDRTHATRTFRDLVRWSGLAASAAVVAAVFGARPLLETLYGTSYLPAAPIFYGLASGLAISLVIGAHASLLTARNAASARLAIAAAQVLSALVLGFLLIPRFGAWGGVAVELAAAGIGAAASIVLVRRRFATATPLGSLLRSAAAAACVIGVVKFLAELAGSSTLAQWGALAASLAALPIAWGLSGAIETWEIGAIAGTAARRCDRPGLRGLGRVLRAIAANRR